SRSLPRARQGPRAVGRPHRALGRPRTRARARATRLCLDRRRARGAGRRSRGRGGTMSDIDTWLAAFRTQAATLSGAGLPWLAAIRQRAIERFADEGWPTNRMEGFRHTSLAFLAQQRFVAAAQPAASAAGSAQATVAQLRREEAGKAGSDAAGGHWLVFVDGVFAPALSAIGALPAGARVDALSAALSRAPERVESAFGNADGGASPAALNAALATDGAFVHLARGIAVGSAFHLVFVAVAAGGACHPRNLLVAEAGAQATVVEHYVGASTNAQDPSSLTNAVTRIDAGPD